MNELVIAHLHQEQTEVFRSEVVRKHEDEEADDGDWNWINEEPESTPKLVGVPGMRQSPLKGLVKLFTMP